MLRWSLVLGGVFNLLMGLIFFSTDLTKQFFHLASGWEAALFSRTALLAVPQDPLHLLLIHGFGAAAIILGATLIYSAQNPAGYRAFILIDGIGRFVFGTMMLTYVFRYQLPRVILLFGLVELTFALIYIAATALKR
jgi:hypothetical protein